VLPQRVLKRMLRGTEVAIWLKMREVRQLHVAAPLMNPNPRRLPPADEARADVDVAAARAAFDEAAA